MYPPPEQIVSAIRAGDPAGAELLYAGVSSVARARLRRMVDRQDLADRIHDVYVAVLESVQAGELRNPERLWGYVSVVAHRRGCMAIVESARERGRVDLDMAALIPDRTPTPEQAFSRAERAGLAGRVLRVLRPWERDILTRFYVRGQDSGSAAREMGMSPTQFRLNKSRAKSRFGTLGRGMLAAA